MVSSSRTVLGKLGLKIEEALNEEGKTKDQALWLELPDYQTNDDYLIHLGGISITTT